MCQMRRSKQICRFLIVDITTAYNSALLKLRLTCSQDDCPARAGLIKLLYHRKTLSFGIIPLVAICIKDCDISLSKVADLSGKHLPFASEAKQNQWFGFDKVLQFLFSLYPIFSGNSQGLPEAVEIKLSEV